ncbi:hypothetical protein PFISCL1PPCAC_21862, partial [Pristionchus fissidentatus]
DKMHAEWSKDKKIKEMKVFMHGNEAWICSARYFFDENEDDEDSAEDSTSWSSIRRISDRLRLLSNICEIGDLMIWVCGGCNVANYRAIIELCIGIRCTDALTICTFDQTCSRSLTDEFLRALMSNKKEVDIAMPCQRITAVGLFALWEDLLDEKFEDLSIRVPKLVVTALFD